MPPLGPQHAVPAIRRRLADAPVLLAEGFARAVRNSSAERLERLMQTPARHVILAGIFWQMPRRVDRTRASGMSSSVRWEITGRSDGRVDTYQLEFSEGQCRVLRGPDASEPRLTITVDGAEFLRLASGVSDPMKAYFSGRVKLAGDVMAAAKLASLFVIPGRAAKRSALG